jgi:hypothetical protein
MKRWIQPNPPPASKGWQSRAEILREHLASLSPLELLRVRPGLYAQTWGWGFERKRYASGRLALYEELERRAGFNPNQPRVPAGNPDGGQWTSEAGASALLVSLVASSGNESRVRLAEARTNSPVISDATPDPIRIGAQYAEAVVTRVDKTGDSRIDNTTGDLIKAMKRAHTLVGEGAGPVYGIMVHSAFATDLKSKNLPGVSVEQSFSLRDVVRYGLDGSIRTDVVLRDINSPNGPPIAIWDLKTGDARLSGARVREIRVQVGVGPEVPVIELRMDRVRNKGWSVRTTSVVFISAQRRNL